MIKSSLVLALICCIPVACGPGRTGLPPPTLISPPAMVTVTLSQAELDAIEAKAHRLVDQLGLSLFAVTLVNSQDNRVEIHISDPDLLQNRLTEHQLELPEHVTIVSSPEVAAGQPPPNLTPALAINFPQLIAPTSLVYSISVVGRLEIQDDCHRLVRDPATLGDLLIWQPDHYLSERSGVIEVLDHDGEVIARTGELSCFSPVAGELNPADADLLRSPLPDHCVGPYFLVGEAELAYQENLARTTMEVSLVDLEAGSLYFIRKTPNLDAWLAEPAAFAGRLVWHAGHRCLRLQRESQAGFQDYLVIWPPEYQLQGESNGVTVLDGRGAVAARLNEDVRLFGSLVVAEETIRTTLNDELPCDCVGGDYLVVIGKNP